MSQVRVMKTSITDANLLSRACERMREAGINVVGPRYEANHPGRNFGKKREAWLVSMPNSIVPTAFFCTADGEAQRDTDQDYGGANKHFERLQMEYCIAGVEPHAQALGGVLENIVISEDQTECSFELAYGG